MTNFLKNIRSFVKVLKLCISISWKSSKAYTLIRSAVMVIIPVITVCNTFVLRTLINYLSGEAYTNQIQISLITFFIIILFLKLLKKSMQEIDKYIINNHNSLIDNHIKMMMIDISINADIEFFDSVEYNDKFASIKRDISLIPNTLWDILNGIGSVTSMVTAFIVVFDLNFIYAVLILIATIPSAFVNKKFVKLFFGLSLDHINDERRMGYLQYILTDRKHAPDIRMYNVGSFFKNKYTVLWNNLFVKKKNLIKRRSTSNALWSLTPELVILAISFVICGKILNSELMIGDYVFYSSMMAQLNIGVFSFIGIVMRIYDNKLRIENIQLFEKYKNSIKDNGECKINEIYSIEFDDVYFKYPNTDNDVLSGISFKVNKGEKVCLVGINGSGKTTIIKLLLRFYDIDKGAIRINGIDIRELSLNDYRKHISLLLQQFTRYSFSIYDNITISDVEKQGNDHIVRDALKMAGAEEILEKVNYDLDTYITKSYEDNGIELSGGQYQKLALARTFFKDSSFIILDEPSSALDPEAEHELFEKFEMLYKGKTALFTSHRLSNVFFADRIVLLENGRILESGTHDELTAYKSRYSEIYGYQADKFINRR